MTSWEDRMRPAASRPDRRSGQILVLFTLAMIAILGFGGLALDGGSAFAQRRAQQTTADLAALAAANEYLINGNTSQAVTRGREVAAANGFTDGVTGTTVPVSIDTSNGIRVSVAVEALHRNSLVGVIGMPTWQVSTAAVALAGFPDTARGASPFIFSASAFGTDGTPLYQTPTDFGEGNGDVPVSQLDFAWTNYGTGNVNTSEVRDIINGSLVIDKTLQFGEYIGQHNNGNHTALYGDVDTYLSGLEVPAAIVDANGNFVGWATFHVISASGGSSKHVRGYFVSSFESGRMTISSCAANDCPRYLGTYVLKLAE
jgi:Flp pilus assembly protein TadG